MINKQINEINEWVQRVNISPKQFVIHYDSFGQFVCSTLEYKEQKEFWIKGWLFFSITSKLKEYQNSNNNIVITIILYHCEMF